MLISVSKTPYFKEKTGIVLFGLILLFEKEIRYLDSQSVEIRRRRISLYLGPSCAVHFIATESFLFLRTRKIRVYSNLMNKHIFFSFHTN